MTSSTRFARKDFEAQQAAYLYAERGMTQIAIGKLLGGLSQPRVSRLLRRAEQQGWLERKYRFVSEALQPERVDQLAAFAEPSSLVDCLGQVDSVTGVRVRGVHVVDSGVSTPASERAWHARLARFGRLTAEPVAELIRRSDVMAVTWGSTVGHVVAGLHEVPWPPGSSRGVRFVPVCGEPLDRASDRATSSHLARALHEIVCGRDAKPLPPSLTGVPALISRRYTGRELQGIWKFVRRAASYSEVFGAGAALVGKVDSLLTSIGTSKTPMGFIHGELLKAGSLPRRKLTAAALSALVVGDIGGVLLPRPGLSTRGRAEVAALNAMWTGANITHLARIAKHAATSTRPGVIVVSTGGEGRAESLAEAIRHGLVNELVIDRVLADALTRVLRAGKG